MVARVGANVRRLREARGWTQEECAYRCNDLGPALLRTIEAGRTNITAATLARLCDGLQVDVAQLFAPAEAPTKRRPGRPKGERAVRGATKHAEGDDKRRVRPQQGTAAAEPEARAPRAEGAGEGHVEAPPTTCSVVHAACVAAIGEGAPADFPRKG
ncbi:MAG: helix-turn-helix transcriptional regulator [Polyangiales bacterium]